jgi:hypothetical protein
MPAEPAKVFDSLLLFYPKLSASMFFGAMALAASSMKTLGGLGNKAPELIEAAPLPPLPIPSRARSTPPTKKKRSIARKSTKRSVRRRKAA